MNTADASSCPIDRARVTITRHRLSVTQGEVSVFYDDTLVERYGDTITMIGNTDPDGAEVCGGYAGRGDTFWINAAAQTLLQRAIKRIDAKEVGPDRYASQAPGCGAGPFVVMSGARLIDFAQHVVSRQEITWDDTTTMPDWWMPEQPFAWRISPAGACGCALDCNADKRFPDNPAADYGMPDNAFERITADLNTGKEQRA